MPPRFLRPHKLNTESQDHTPRVPASLAIQQPITRSNLHPTRTPPYSPSRRVVRVRCRHLQFIALFDIFTRFIKQYRSFAWRVCLWNPPSESSSHSTDFIQSLLQNLTLNYHCIQMVMCVSSHRCCILITKKLVLTQTGLSSLQYCVLLFLLFAVIVFFSTDTDKRLCILVLKKKQKQTNPWLNQISSFFSLTIIEFASSRCQSIATFFHHISSVLYYRARFYSND